MWGMLKNERAKCRGAGQLTGTHCLGQASPMGPTLREVVWEVGVGVLSYIPMRTQAEGGNDTTRM